VTPNKNTNDLKQNMAQIMAEIMNYSNTLTAIKKGGKNRPFLLLVYQ